MNTISTSFVKHLGGELFPTFAKTVSKTFANIVFKNTESTEEGLKPGHISIKFSESEMKRHESLFNTRTSSEYGHQPNYERDVLRRESIETEIGGRKQTYTNVTRPALPLGSPQNFGGTPEEQNLGELTDEQLKVFTALEKSGKFNLYALRGDKPIDKGSLTPEDVKLFLTEGKLPRHAPNCVDFMKAVLLEWAKLGRTSQERDLQFEAKLADCRVPQDIADLAQAHFAPDENGFMRFQPSARTGPCVDLRASTHYGKFLEASGLPREVFDKMCAQLAEKGLIFGEVFENDEQWGTTFFSELGNRLRECKPHEGVGAVCYHKDTYPGDITHVSLIAISPSGDVSICHHESIPLSKDKPKTTEEKKALEPIDNLMHGIAGVPSNSYDTADIHKRVQGSDVKQLPIMESYKSSGPPMVKFTPLGDFGALRKFNEETARESYIHAKELPYGTDPDQHLMEKKGAFLKGIKTPEETKHPRLKHEPLRLPPGEKDTTSAGAYTNNCAAYTLRCLQAGRCKDLPTTVGPVGELRLSEVADILLQAGLMPCTDPKAAEKMDLAGSKYSTDTGATAHPGSFLALAYLWSNAAPDTPGAYPADVPRNEVSSDKKAALEQKRKMQLDGIEKTITKNQKSFEDIPNVLKETENIQNSFKLV